MTADTVPSWEKLDTSLDLLRFRQCATKFSPSAAFFISTYPSENSLDDTEEGTSDGSLRGWPCWLQRYLSGQWEEISCWVVPYRSLPPSFVLCPFSATTHCVLYRRWAIQICLACTAIMKPVRTVSANACQLAQPGCRALSHQGDGSDGLAARH